MDDALDKIEESLKRTGAKYEGVRITQESIKRLITKLLASKKPSFKKEYIIRELKKVLRE